jgi:hemoglobin-like flavoprotein
LIVELKGDIVAIAKRHEQYVVKPHHYNLGRVASIWTLQKVVGTKWNGDAKAAWVMVMLFYPER